MLVWVPRRRRQVPGPSVRLVMQGVGDAAMRCRTTGESSGVIDRGTDERMRETHSLPLDLHKPGLLGRNENVALRPAELED